MARLLWTDEQKRWLKDHIGILDVYTRMTSVPHMQQTLRHEIKMLQAVQQAVIHDTRRLPVLIEVWAEWAYWYSAAWLATKFSPAPEHAQQFEDSAAFRLTLLIQRDARLQALTTTKR